MASNIKRQSIWESLPLEELAHEQGVIPVSDLNEVAALWPTKDDPDDLLSFLLTERKSRREAARKSH